MQVLICFSLILAFCLDNTIRYDVRIQSQGTKEGMVQGVVVGLPGTPIPNASVYARNMENMREEVRGTADKDGKFALSVRHGKWFVHAYKEEASYPDCFLWFGGGASEKAWRVVDVQSGQSVTITIELGPKFATLELLINDEKDVPTGAGLKFTWQGAGDLAHRTSATGHDVSGFKRYFIPPERLFQFRIEKEGYEIWRSKNEKGGDWITLKSGETLSITVKLKRSR